MNTPRVVLVADSLVPEYIELSVMWKPPMVAPKATRSLTLTFSAVMDLAVMTEPLSEFSSVCSALVVTPSVFSL